MTQNYNDLYGLFSVDFDALYEFAKNVHGNGVITGLGATVTGADLTVTIGTGKARVNGIIRTFGSTTNVSFTGNPDATNPKKALIVVTSAGAITKRLGTAAAAEPSGSVRRETVTPDPPELTSGDVVLCEVWLTANMTAIASVDVSDRRMDAIFSQLGYRIANEFPGTDIGAQINNAMTDLGASGGIVFVLPGSYTQTTIIVPQNNIWLRGAGRSTNIATTTNDIDQVDTLSAVSNFWISDIWFTTVGTGNTNQTVVLSGGVTNFRFFRNEVSGKPWDVIIISEATKDVLICDNYIKITTSRDTAADIFVLDGGMGAAQHIQIVNNFVDVQTGGGGSFVVLGTANSVLIEGNTVLYAAGTTVSRGIYFNSTVSNCVIADNVFEGPVGQGIRLDLSNTTRITVKGNVFGPGLVTEGIDVGSAVTDVLIVGNFFHLTVNNNVAIDLAGDRCLVANNYCFVAAAATGTKFLNIVSGSDNHSVIGNYQMNGGVSTDAGTGSRYAGNRGIGRGSAHPPNYATLVARSATLPASSAPTAAKIDGTNVSYDVLDFADASTTSCYWVFALPQDWEESDIVFRIRWRATTATTNNVVWDVAVLGRVETEAIDAALTAFGNTTGDAAAGTAGLISEFVITFAAGSFDLVAGDLLIVRLQRLGAHANDTMTDVARFVEMTVELR